MRVCDVIIIESKLDADDVRDALAKLSPTYAKVRKHDELEEGKVMKTAGMALAFVAVALGGINVSMIGPMQAQAAQEISQTIERDLQQSYKSLPNGYVDDDGNVYTLDDWQVEIEPAEQQDSIDSSDSEPNTHTAPSSIEAQIAQHMQQRIADAEAQGITVEHNYSERHDQVPDEFTASYGPWEGRPTENGGYANVPDKPSIANLLVMEEEFAHALGSDESLYGTDPIHMLWEEFRAKRFAELMVSQHFDIDAAGQSQLDFTTNNYIDFARQMSQYTRQVYSDELIAEIRADAERVAEQQFRSGEITVTNSGDRFAEYFAR